MGRAHEWTSVSILTDPEGPVQPEGKKPSPQPNPVSILTDPEGPVQPTIGDLSVSEEAGFNPHRPRRAGATMSCATDRSSRATVSILTDPEGPVQRSMWSRIRSRTRCFNPHRPRRAGATVNAEPSYPANSGSESPALTKSYTCVFSSVSCQCAPRHTLDHAHGSARTSLVTSHRHRSARQIARPPAAHRSRCSGRSRSSRYTPRACP